VVVNGAGSTCVLMVSWLVVPLGVCAAGLVFTARDVVHEVLGGSGVLAAITTGTVVSMIVATPCTGCRARSWRIGGTPA
jgi:uncharacterized PurR-regulated membrane protein YhhQ (DUF165 family)